jgi:hypothetical protein
VVGRGVVAPPLPNGVVDAFCSIGLRCAGRLLRRISSPDRLLAPAFFSLRAPAQFRRVLLCHVSTP